VRTEVESSGGTSTALETQSPRAEETEKTPWWVRGLTSGGRPVVLLVALLMCAPGEYKLARLAGWADPFAYGMPFVLSAYAGIAAAVATTRRKDEPGHVSAVAGAVLALLLAVSAQVFAHLLSGGYVHKSPGLVAAVSLIPPAVVGHLLHLAATPARKRTEETPVAETSHAAVEIERTEETPAEESSPALEGTVLSSPPSGETEWTPAQLEIIKLWKSGLSPVEASEKSGRSKSYVYKIYQEIRREELTKSTDCG
jgi:hypothetical protein